jgi:hypothetical protein
MDNNTPPFEVAGSNIGMKRSEETRKMLDKAIEEFITQTGEGIVIDRLGDQFIMENTSFVSGKKTDIKIKATGTTLSICMDNFVYQLQQIKYKEKNDKNDDIDNYRWLCSY